MDLQTLKSLRNICFGVLGWTWQITKNLIKNLYNSHFKLQYFLSFQMASNEYEYNRYFFNFAKYNIVNLVQFILIFLRGWRYWELKLSAEWIQVPAFRGLAWSWSNQNKKIPKCRKVLSNQVNNRPSRQKILSDAQRHGAIWRSLQTCRYIYKKTKALRMSLTWKYLTTLQAMFPKYQWTVIFQITSVSTVIKPTERSITNSHK
jgi:hypothetical protein